MGGVIGQIFAGGAGGLLSGVSGIINSIKGRNPEDAAKLQELLSKHQDLVIQTDAEMEKARLQANVDLNKTAAANIQVEAGQNWYTASARPSIVWCWIVLMMYNYMLAPLFHRPTVTFPDL